MYVRVISNKMLKERIMNRLSDNNLSKLLRSFIWQPKVGHFTSENSRQRREMITKFLNQVLLVEVSVREINLGR